MTAAFAIPQKNDPGLSRGRFSKASFPTGSFLFPEVTVTNDKTTANAAKASVITRNGTLSDTREKLRQIAGKEGYVKDRVRNARLFLLPVLPEIKFSRVKEILSNEQRIKISGEEREGILHRWEAWLEREERRHAMAAENVRKLLNERGRHARSSSVDVENGPAACAVGADRDS